ncbi:MAG: carboxymuconolactone decarboxylase family protein, partial [Candidatus Methanoperedens sp.]|nr:carboxymuconolactone decarboxylase family protein [Candidatus Methanoperedens sp.]
LITKILYDNSIIREFKRLDPKTIELISIGVSAALKCPHCLKMHIRVAQRLGVTKEEIFDAILIAGSLSNATVLAEGTRAIDAEVKEKCKVCGITEEKNKT